MKKAKKLIFNTVLLSAFPLAAMLYFQSGYVAQAIGAWTMHILISIVLLDN